MKEEIEQLLKQLQIPFKSLDLYIEAFTHRSYINEQRSEKINHNERLEFLGDAVLELVITEYIYSQYPEHTEGDLTSFRAAIVRTDSLALQARELNYGKSLRMSKGEEASGGKDKDYLLANTFEAVLGAMYLDLGYEVAKEFVYKTLVPKIQGIVDARLDIDAKTKFQEIAQAVFKQTPIYTVVSEDGPDHDKTFTMAVMIGDREFGQGKGPSKQKAEENAALQGLEIISSQPK